MSRKHWTLALQAAVTAALLLLLFRDFDWISLRRLLRSLPVAFYAWSFATVLAGQLAYAFRWHLVLRALAVRLPFSATLRQFAIGLFFNNFLPSTIGGDSAKIFYLGRLEGYSRAAASVFADRVLGLTLMLFVAVASTLFVVNPGPAWIAARNTLAGLLAGVAAVLAVVALASPDAWLRSLARRWPAASARIDDGIRIVGYVRTVLRHPRVLAAAVVIVSGYFLLLGLVYQRFIEFVTGSSPPLLPVIGAIAIISALSSIPVAINGLGVREQLHLVFLGVFGLTAEAAAGISLLLFAHGLLVSLSGAVAWLRTSGRQEKPLTNSGGEGQG
jgi:uncharacterized protein (TIRG00374 family)